MPVFHFMKGWGEDYPAGIFSVGIHQLAPKKIVALWDNSRQKNKHESSHHIFTKFGHTHCDECLGLRGLRVSIYYRVNSFVFWFNVSALLSGYKN